LILKGNQRAGAKQMALHLMSNENDHVEVHQVDGFMADDVQGALQEIYAASKATKCKKFMFSLSLSPPKEATATNEDFDNAINQVEKKLGLENQSKVVVFHEKEGRRHAHCVWSRIDTDKMKAIKLNYYKRDLNTIAKDLFIEHDWDLPKGFEDTHKRDLRTFDLDEWQQAKRHNLSPKQIKARIQYCWKQSDNKASFKTALEHEGFFLARGDKKSVHVAVDWHGEVYAITRNTGQKAKDVRARLGKADSLPTVETIKSIIKKEQSALHLRLQKELIAKHQMQSQPLLTQKAELVTTQQDERKSQQATHEARQQHEQQQRQAQYRKGLHGLWQLVTGRYHKQKQQHECEHKAGLERDKKEKQQLVAKQLKTRQALQINLDTLNTHQQKESMQLNCDLMANYKNNSTEHELKTAFTQSQKLSNHARSTSPEISL
jgi:hypothetical protein